MNLLHTMQQIWLKHRSQIVIAYITIFLTLLYYFLFYCHVLYSNEVQFFLEELDSSHCIPTISRVASPDTNTAQVDLTFRGVTQVLELPIGQHPYYLQTRGLACNMTINVYGKMVCLCLCRFSLL